MSPSERANYEHQAADDVQRKLHAMAADIALPQSALELHKARLARETRDRGLTHRLNDVRMSDEDWAEIAKIWNSGVRFTQDRTKLLSPLVCLPDDAAQCFWSGDRREPPKSL